METAMFGVGALNPLWNAGYVTNPFRVLTDDEWEDVAVMPDALARVATSGLDENIQVLGEAGRGKSTALRGLTAFLRQSGCLAEYEYVPPAADRFLGPQAGTAVYCLDEAQRLCPRERIRLLDLAARGIRLVLGSHEDLATVFDRQALHLTTIRLDASNKIHAAAVWERRLSYFAAPDRPRAALSPSAVSYLHRRFGSDLRSAERFLYTYFQSHVRTPDRIDGIALGGFDDAV